LQNPRFWESKKPVFAGEVASRQWQMSYASSVLAVQLLYRTLKRSVHHRRLHDDEGDDDDDDEER